LTSHPFKTYWAKGSEKCVIPTTAPAFFFSFSMLLAKIAQQFSWRSIGTSSPAMIAKALLISADGNLCESMAGALSTVKSCDLEVLASFERSQSRLVSAEPSIVFYHLKGNCDRKSSNY